MSIYCVNLLEYLTIKFLRKILTLSLLFAIIVLFDHVVVCSYCFESIVLPSIYHWAVNTVDNSVKPLLFQGGEAKAECSSKEWEAEEVRIPSCTNTTEWCDFSSKGFCATGPSVLWSILATVCLFWVTCEHFVKSAVQDCCNRNPSWRYVEVVRRLLMKTRHRCFLRSPF